MKEVIVDLKFIAEHVVSTKIAFDEFKQKVKTISLSQFDLLAHPVVVEVTSKIDCTQCGNCCRHQEPGVTNAEVQRLAGLQHMEEENFKNKFVAWDKEGVSFLCLKPCIFLSGNECSIYSDRPNSCADFPGLHRPRLKWRMKQVEENYAICPIVFNVVEQLKRML